MHILAEGAAAVSIWDTVGFAAAGATVFTLLGLITWSFRDVANRHAHKADNHKGNH